jgi:hypothetical protein
MIRKTPMWLTNSMEHSPSCEARQKITHLVWTQKIHYQVQKSLPLVAILSKMNPVHILTLQYYPPSGLFPSGLWTKILYAFIISPMPHPSKPS